MKKNQLLISDETVGPALTPLKIGEFESEIGTVLPRDYRDFLLKTNGGCFKQDSFIAIPNGQVTMFDQFYGILDSRPNSIHVWMKELEDNLPNGLLPIANDAGNNQFLLNPSDVEAGVYYWDWQLLFDTSDEVNNIYFVAKSFSAFCKLITSSIEEAESTPKTSGKFFQRQTTSSDINPVKTSEPWMNAADIPLEVRLDKLAENFDSFCGAGRIHDTESAAFFGFTLVANKDDWTQSHKDFNNLLVSKKINEAPEIVELVQRRPIVLFYYAMAFAFVEGLLWKDLIDGKVFMSSKKLVFAAVLRNEPLISDLASLP